MGSLRYAHTPTGIEMLIILSRVQILLEIELSKVVTLSNHAAKLVFLFLITTEFM